MLVEASHWNQLQRDEINTFVMGEGMLVEPFLQPNYVMLRILGVEWLVL